MSSLITLNISMLLNYCAPTRHPNIFLLLMQIENNSVKHLFHFNKHKVKPLKNKTLYFK
jgi:hypothetical protein